MTRFTFDVTLQNAHLNNQKVTANVIAVIIVPHIGERAARHYIVVKELDTARHVNGGPRPVSQILPKAATEDN